ncbi:MAG: hypothetical protein Q9174_005298 [Haloplaca sp. 1 TL-2023]
MLGEFTGTFLFLFFAFAGTQVANTKEPDASISSSPDPASLLYISLCFGFSLAVNAWVFFRISGGLFNPAGMCLIGALTWVRGGLLIISQILGAMTSAAVVSALFPGPLNVQTALSPGTSIAQGLFIEMFLTFQLVFTIFMLAAEKHKGTYIAPVGIGLSLFIAELTGVYYTGGSLNPARSFGPSVVLHSFEGYHWIYWLGPILGALLAAAFYKFIKMLEYETANPGQDFDDREQEFFDPSQGNTRPIVNFTPDGTALVDEGTSRPDSGLPDLENPGKPLQYPPPVEERERERQSAMKGGRSRGSSGGRLDDEAGAGYQKGPDVEAGRAMPRESGRV